MKKKINNKINKIKINKYLIQKSDFVNKKRKEPIKKIKN